MVREQYREQLGWAVEEGIDFVIAETNDFVGEALIGLEVCQELGLPAMVTFASVKDNATYDGYEYVEACKVLADHGATVVGLNCSRGPETMLPLLERLRAAVDIPIAAQPVPYRTDAATPAFESLKYPDGRRAFPISLEPFAHTRFEMADFARQAADLASDTSVSAAAERRTTSGRWPRRSAGRPRPAGTLRPWTCTRCSAPCRTPPPSRSWATGAPAPEPHPNQP